jgi:hypothetical protein
MLEPADLERLKQEIYFVPQAVLPYEIRSLAKNLSFKVETGTDDLDEFAGAAFFLDELPFALMHYRGHPENTSTIYLPYDVKSLNEIERWIDRIVSELKLRDKFVWRRDRDSDEDSSRSVAQ